jgi:hypothetical protein
MNVATTIAVSLSHPFELRTWAKRAGWSAWHSERVGVIPYLERLLAAARRLPAIVGHEVPGQVAKAGPSTRLHPAPESVAQLRAQFA